MSSSIISNTPAPEAMPNPSFDVEELNTQQDEGQRPYLDKEVFGDTRSIAMSSIISLIVAIIGGVAFWDTLYLFVPLVGIVFGFSSASRVKRFSDELSGRGISIAAIVLSSCMFFGAIAWHVYVYATEVPEGFERLTYSELKPDERHPEKFRETLAQKVGKPVFIKGFMFPGSENTGIRTFILCKDNGDCCFGGNPKIEERVLVTITDPYGVGFSKSEQKFTGIFRVAPMDTSPDVGKGGVWYHLDNAVQR